MNPPMNFVAVRPFRLGRDRRHLRKSVALSLLMHAFAATFLVFLAWCFGWTTLKDLLAQRTSLPATGPAPEQTVTMELLPQPPTPPMPAAPPPPQPPAPNPAIVQQLPKPAVPHAPTAHPKTVAQTRPKPKAPFTAAHATGAGLTPEISPPRLGTKGLPVPGYPLEALYRAEGGTVSMQVVFGSDGGVQRAEVQQSSGSALLDNYTRTFIYAHWKNASYANTTVRIPIIYDPGKTVTSAGP
jgi:TonB family protein